MHSWIRFFRANTSLVLFGLLLTFFSSFGQTFLLSLYVPEILRDFRLTNGEFGSIYALATLASALCLTWAGRFIDTVDLKKFSWMVTGGLFVSLLIFSQAHHIAVLIIAIWGLRLSGQGLMSHTAITTMARYFDHVRGKAISITSLGHPLGEAVLPLLIAFGISYLGWRETLLFSAGLLILVLPAAVGLLLRHNETDPGAFRAKQEKQLKNETAEEKETDKMTYRKLISTRAFWLIAPNVFALSFLNTAFFFYQIPLAESKGWTTEWVAASFTAFALTSAACLLIAGQLVDRFSAARLFPFYMFPFLGAILLVVSSDSPWITPVYLVLIGISNGFGKTIKTAVQAELFGIGYLGTVRSLFTALMVVSTAMGPAVFGLLLDAGLSFEETLGIAAVYLVLTIGWSFRILHKRQLLRWYSSLKSR